MSTSAEQLLVRLRALDVTLRVEGGRLRVSAPAHVLTPALEDELRAAKPALIEALEREAAAAQAREAGDVSIPRATAPLRMSYVQERIWLQQQLQPSDTAYNLAVLSAERRCDDDGALLRAALADVVAAHDILRARFVMRGSTPEIEVHDSHELAIVTHDLSAVPDDALADALDEAAWRAARVPFDLAAEPPIRFALLRREPGVYVVLTVVHHVAADAWSLSTLQAEIDRAVTARIEGGRLPAPALQYADFAHWQRDRVDGPQLADSLQYWTTRLHDLPQLSTFIPDRPRRVDAAGEGATWNFSLEAALADRLRAAVRTWQGTPYMGIVALMAGVLARCTDQRDVVLGSPVGTRATEALESVIGPFLNSLVLRLDLHDDPSFAQLFARVREAVLDAHEHEDVPFDRLVQELNPDRVFGRSPLFQVAVVLNNAPASTDATSVVTGGAVHDVTLYAAERDGRIDCTLEYRTDLYDEATMQRIAGYLVQLLEGALAAPDIPLSRVDIVPPDERRTLLGFNPPPAVLDPRPLVAQFEAMAAAAAHRIAVSDGTRAITYADLEARSAAVAHGLVAMGVLPGEPVAVSSDRTPDLLVAVLGILRSGAAYVPIELGQPLERIRFMLDDAGCRHLLLAGTGLLTGERDRITATAVLDLATVERDGTARAAPLPAVSPDGLAYVLYTSGSTGQPKGVEVTHAALSNFLGTMRRMPAFSADDVVLAVTSCAFDISILELLLPLTVGARVVIAARDTVTDATALTDFVRLTAPTVVQSTPSGWRLLLSAGWDGAGVRLAICGGEALPPDLAERLCALPALVLNAYGPTETTIWSSLWRVAPGRPMSVGAPVDNARIYVVDPNSGLLAPMGGVGELCIGGAGVARGYRHREALTRERFVADPFAPEPGARMYRTGDLGRWRPDGTLELFGRSDGQIKLRGFRIEAGEVEAALGAHPDVDACAVGVREVGLGDARLVAWVVPRGSSSTTPSELRRHVRARLPDYMVPSIITFIERMPITTSGKVNHRLLPNPFAGAATPTAVEPPQAGTETLVAEIWTRILGVPPTSRHDMFFELGGHSLLAMRAAREIGERTETIVDPRTLFFRTLADIAATCDVQRASRGGLAS